MIKLKPSIHFASILFILEKLSLWVRDFCCVVKWNPMYFGETCQPFLLHHCCSIAKCMQSLFYLFIKGTWEDRIIWIHLFLPIPEKLKETIILFSLSHDLRLAQSREKTSYGTTRVTLQRSLHAILRRRTKIINLRLLVKENNVIRWSTISTLNLWFLFVEITSYHNCFFFFHWKKNEEASKDFYWHGLQSKVISFLCLRKRAKKKQPISSTNPCSNLSRKFGEIIS